MGMFQSFYFEFDSGDATDAIALDHCARIIHLLQNAPQLSALEFTDFHCTFEDLEILHENAPKLHTLILLNHIEIALTNEPINPIDPDRLALLKPTEVLLTDSHQIGFLEFAYLSHLEIRFGEYIYSGWW